ncbi:MAG: hypothetical protein ABSE42_14390, partial [Bryobacteraceae bacterium]
MAKRDPVLFLCVLCLFLPFPGAYGASIGVTWSGTSGGSWNTAANWTPSDVPNNGANTFGVTISGSGTSVSLLGGIAIDSLTMNSSTLNMTSGGPNSLTLAVGPSSLNGAQIQGGTLTNNGTLTLNAATFNNSVLNNSGTVNATATLNVLSGALINNNGASVNVTNGSALQLETGGTYTNNGTINMGSTGSPTGLLLDASTSNGAFGGTVTLGGSGSLTLSNSANNLIREQQSGLTLVNGSD